MEVLTQSPAETQKLGKKIGLDLKSGKIKKRILCLYGDLGSGKTTFIQGLAKGLGIKKRITSPTFVLIKKYCAKLYHIDLYRIEKTTEIEGLGLSEIFHDPQAVVAIEWAEKIACLPENMKIYFDYLSDNQRKIVIKK